MDRDGNSLSLSGCESVPNVSLNDAGSVLTTAANSFSHNHKDLVLVSRLNTDTAFHLPADLKCASFVIPAPISAEH